MHRTSHHPSTDPHDLGSTAAVVAVESAGPFVRVFTRSASGVTFHDYPFKPFFFLADPAMLETSPVFTARRHLEGRGALCWLAEVTTWHDWCRLRDHLQQTGKPETWFGISDSCQQFLISSGIRFFSGLLVDEVTVLCIAVTVDNSDGQFRHQRITGITLADSNGYGETLNSHEMAEPEMLERLSNIIRDRDPDVLTGYRLTGFDLPAVVRRADYYGLRLGWGRDGSEPHLLQGQDKHGYQRSYAVYGRSVVDTLTLVRHYDRQVSPLPGTGLTQVAEWFGCAAHQDALAIMGLYKRLAPAWHLQAQCFPVSFQAAVSRPAAAAASALLIQEYLKQHHALPAPLIKAKEQVSGTLLLCQRGQAGPVALCDLSELSTSIMLSYRIAPQSDDLNIFLAMLKALKRLCSQHQESAALPVQPLLLSAWSDLLDSPQLLFSDPDAAAELKRLGRVLTGDLLGWLKEQGARPVYADQQAICFVPPEGHTGEEDIAALIRHLSGVLPHGATLNCRGQYQAIFVYSQNNFALLEQNGTMVYRGSRFSYHSMEPFLLEFLKEALGLLLENKAEEVRNLYARYLRRLTLHDCPVTWLMRTETLADTPEHYRLSVQSGKRNRAAVYELALSMPETWRVGDRISYYVAGNSKNVAVHDCCRFVSEYDPAHPDLNIPWYIERLDQLFKRFEPFLPTEPMLF